jgi:hypothetical protein
MNVIFKGDMKTHTFEFSERYGIHVGRIMLTVFVPEFIGVERPPLRVAILLLLVRRLLWFEEWRTSVPLQQKDEYHPLQQEKHLHPQNQVNHLQEDGR